MSKSPDTDATNMIAQAFGSDFVLVPIDDPRVPSAYRIHLARKSDREDSKSQSQIPSNRCFHPRDRARRASSRHPGHP